MPRASATPGEGARDTRRPRRPGTIYIHTYIWRCYTARTYVDTIIKSGVPTPWRVPCLPCLAVCPSPSVHVGGSRAEDRRLSYRGVWQCSPRPPVSRGERDDSNDGWEHGGHGRPRLTRGLYGWALRSRIIKGAQRALPCLALPCLAPRPPPQGLTGKEPRVLLVGFSPTAIPSSPPLLQLVPKAHTQRPKTRVLEKKKARWKRMVVPRAGPPVRLPSGTGRAGLGPPAGACCRRPISAILPHARPAAEAGATPLPPDVAPRRKAKRGKAGEHSLVSGLAPTHGSSAVLHGRYICMRCRCPQIHQTQYTPPPVGRAVGGGHVLPVAPKTHACLPACFPVHLSSKRTWTRAGSRLQQCRCACPKVPRKPPGGPNMPMSKRHNQSSPGHITYMIQ